MSDILSRDDVLSHCDIDGKPIRKFDYRNISITSVAALRCGAFKYNEMVLCDKNVTKCEYRDFLYNKGLTTKLIALHDVTSDIENIFTIWRHDRSTDIRHGTEARYCDKPGLLLQANTTLFELVTIPSIDQFYPKNDDSYMDKLVISYSLTSGSQSRRAIDELFLTGHGGKIVTIVITDSAFKVIERVNAAIEVKRSLNSIELISLTKKKTIVDDHVYDNDLEFMTINSILKKYNYCHHRFYATIGCHVDGVDSLTTLHGAVICSESMYEFNTPHINGEFLRHYTDERTQAPKDLIPILRVFMKNLVHRDGTYLVDKCLTKSKNPEIWRTVTAIYNANCNDKLRLKYTIAYSMERVIALINLQAKNGTHNIVRDVALSKFAEYSDVDDKQMPCHVIEDDTSFDKNDEYDDGYNFL